MKERGIGYPGHGKANTPEKWDSIIDKLYSSGLITGVDTSIISLFCDGMADYIIVADRIEYLRTHATDEKTMLSWYKVKSRIWQSVTKLAFELHLSPGDEIRTIIPPETKDPAQQWIENQKKA